MANEPYTENPKWTTVDNYVFTSIHPPSSSSPSLIDTLTKAQANNLSSGLPDIAVSPPQGKFLMLQARLIQAKTILEVGTLGGYSTIWLANSTEQAKVVTIEVNPKHAEIAKQNFETAGVAEKIEVLVGPGTDILPKLAQEVKEGKREKFEMVFIDADKENNWNYVESALGMTRSGALILVDNVVRYGKVVDEGTEDKRVLGSRKVIEKVGKDERLEGTVLQTVGEKGWDGLLFAVVK